MIYSRTVEKFPQLRNWGVKKMQNRRLKQWEQKGKPIPPPHIVKQQTLKMYAKKYNLKILIESGTFWGDMIEATRENFDKLITIELSKKFHKLALKRFKNDKKVEFIWGDSGVEIEKVLKKLNQPALFWLDGHFSAGMTQMGLTETPIFKELNHIAHAKRLNHVILIDDARQFGHHPDYPKMETLETFIHKNRPYSKIQVINDIIAITPY